jgi:hypothetical protein
MRHIEVGASRRDVLCMLSSDMSDQASAGRSPEIQIGSNLTSDVRRTMLLTWERN